MLPAFTISKHYTAIAGHYLPRRGNHLPSLAFVNHIPNKRDFHRARPLYLNRILFDTSEIDDGNPTDNEEVTTGTNNNKATAPLATVTFSKDDYRTIHVAKILGLQNGDTLRAGSVRSPSSQEEEGNNNNHQRQLAGLTTDDATVTWLPEGKIKKAQPTKNGDPPGSLQISIPHPPKTSLWNDRNVTTITEDGTTTDLISDTPSVSLLLALPRPLQLSRILPMISQLGIDQLILTNAKKVPKDYFGSHIFRKPEVLRDLLVEGLAQSGDVTLPNVTVTKRLKVFMEDEFDEMFPLGEVARVIAHPQRRGVVGDDDDGKEGEVGGVKRMTDVEFPGDGPRRIVVAVGPEGGWEEPYELDMFTSKGFQQITLGTRVLRSDVAVVSLLALAHEVCATGDRSD
eukprot:CAMPEP_0202005702 /NCGR_PEP_ID=MMETSP0905-20130828/10679_1 /ASSEMBLY_ACC=CAM_ASM_000554 /TAXON_ID=420261 /ORGANISM="Thalassiosira antarctica, Strain CCMP982" /LENGTH=398 /DNA_ID=CAMNT_0048563319 /DNA_START=52 /DNA_END=1248 /DNA_ORIENTATION=+